MASTITRLALGGMGDFSSYLIKTEKGFLLIDTGIAPLRASLEKGLERAACFPGDLRLVILTNGTMDATGNCAYIQEKYGAKVAVHFDDAEMVERELPLKRKWKSRAYEIVGMLTRPLARKMLRKLERFKPDILIDEGFDLLKFGFNAKVVHIPGFTKGSIGILTRDGGFFSGISIFKRGGRYSYPFVLSSFEEYEASVKKIMSLGINTFYPSLGKAFSMWEYNRARGD